MRFQSGKDDRKSIALTIYNDFTAVREVRTLNAEKEVDQLIITDFPSGIEADSFFIKGVTVLEQEYEGGITDKEHLLKKYIGKVITVRNLEAGIETKVRLLKAGPDFIGKIEETGEFLINPAGELTFPVKAEGIQLEPAITCRIEPKQGTAEIDLHYLVSGLSWEANYTAELSEGKLILNGWIKILNYAGADFENCHLSAVAGILKRSGETTLMRESRQFNPKALHGEVDSYSYSEGKIYNLEGTFSIAESASKQIRFIHNQNAVFQKIYRIEERKENATVQLQFGGPDLDFTLPKGTIKFYERGGEGKLEFIGEDVIGYVPANEMLQVRIGETYDLTNKSREKSRKTTADYEYVTFEYYIKNTKQKNCGVLIEHIISDHIWEMESSTHDYEVKDSHTLEFHVRIGAGKTVELEFTYKAKNRTNEKLRKF